MTITVYSKPACVACDATYRKLDKHGIEYSSVNIIEDPEALTFVRGLDPSYAQAPVVLVEFADGTSAHWSGYSPDRLEKIAAAAASVDRQG